MVPLSLHGLTFLFYHCAYVNSLAVLLIFYQLLIKNKKYKKLTFIAAFSVSSYFNAYLDLCLVVYETA